MAAQAAHAASLPAADLPDQPVTAKAALRTRIKLELKSADASSLADQSARICSHLRKLPAVADAKRVVAYLACKRLREVDLTDVVKDVLARKQALFVPRVKDKASNMAMLRIESLDGLQTFPPFGIVEPTELDEQGARRQDLLRDSLVPDVVLLPGLGFDRQGGRLGRGGGYYDKFLADLMRMTDAGGAARPLLIGVAFAEQVVDTVPVDTHDFLYDMLVTPKGVQARP